MEKALSDAETQAGGSKDAARREDGGLGTGSGALSLRVGSLGVGGTGMSQGGAAMGAPWLALPFAHRDEQKSRGFQL